MTEQDIDDGVANYRASAKLSAADKAALFYSEAMATAPALIDADFYAQLRRHYADDEIVELGLFIGFNIGYHTFFGTLKFYPLFAPDGRLVDQDESARIYGANPSSLAGTAPR